MIPERMPMIPQIMPLDMVKKAATFAQNHHIKDGEILLDAERIYFYSPLGKLSAWVKRDATNGRRLGSYWVLDGEVTK